MTHSLTLAINRMVMPYSLKNLAVWVRSRNCGCLVAWFCYQLIAKPGNRTATVLWPDPYRMVMSYSLQNCVVLEPSCNETHLIDRTYLKLTTDTPLLAREGELWGVCCEPLGENCWLNKSTVYTICHLVRILCYQAKIPHFSVTTY